MSNIREYKIYGKPTCSFCRTARLALEARNIDYEYVEIGKDISRDDFIEKFPNQKTVPMIWYRGALVGGWEQLKDKLGIE